ncbi:MAG: tetratricopeptide repeat protein [Rubrivivax sp.]|jgi:predicted TPR repeat methyltransferase|nr:tetratricopeptide repeat protein [Rubrivivax sp.]
MPSTEPFAETPTADLLAQAMNAHRVGQVPEAREAYMAVLHREPQNADCLHMLGALEGQFGSDEVAAYLIGKAIEISPQEAMFHNNLGNVLLNLKRPEEAEAAYRHAVALEPGRYDAINNLAVLVGRRGDRDGAEKLFKELLEVAPGFTDARENLASLYLRNGRLNDALTQCAIGLVTSPRAKGLRRLLGLAYSTWDMPEQAAAVYRDWIKDEPDDPQPAHYLAAITGVDVPARATDAFVKATFDGFADSFDTTLAELEYRAPTFMGEALDEALGAPTKTLRVADAGCGTGLCAQHVGPWAKTLSGVDLSVPMLKLAAARQVYDELIHGELVAYLRERPAAFDVLISADTLCYFGDLQEFAHAARASLCGNGWLVFTVESHADEAGAKDFSLQGHGRYSHRAGYLQQVLREAGFEEPVLRQVILRKEATKPVQGWLVRAQVSAAWNHPTHDKSALRTSTHG